MSKLGLLLLTIVIAGCTAESERPALENAFEAPVALEQNLALPRKSLVIRGKENFEFGVEVASTPEERRIGLMNRTFLAESDGMLFVFERPTVQNFWMKNTLIPLDMLYLDENRKIVRITHNAQPCKVENCPLYSSFEPAQYVLEINGGQANMLGISVGDEVEWID